MNPYGFRHLAPEEAVKINYEDHGLLFALFTTDETSIPALVDILNQVHLPANRLLRSDFYDFMSTILATSIRNAKIVLAGHTFFQSQQCFRISSLVDASCSIDVTPNGMTVQPFEVIKQIIWQYENQTDQSRSGSDFELYRDMWEYAKQNSDQRVEEYLAYLCQAKNEAEKCRLLFAWDQREKEALQKLEEVSRQADTHFATLPRDVSVYLVKPYLEKANYAQ